jgi:hypothetical protein
MLQAASPAAPAEKRYVQPLMVSEAAQEWSAMLRKTFAGHLTGTNVQSQMARLQIMPPADVEMQTARRTARVSSATKTRIDAALLAVVKASACAGTI